MQIMDTLEKLNDSIEFLKLLVPSPSHSNLSSYDNDFTPLCTKPPPITYRHQTKLIGQKKSLYDNGEKKPQHLQRTNIPINTKYLTLKRNCTLVSDQSKHGCDDYYRMQEKSKSKTKFFDSRPSQVSSSQNKVRLTNIDNGTSGKTSKIRTPTLVNKNFSSFSSNNKIFQTNNSYTNSRFNSKNVDLVRLKLNAKIPEYSSSINEKSHLKFDDRKILNQIYYI